MAYGFNEDKSKFELDKALEDLDNQKANAEHTHSAEDITDGTLAVARGGTGQASLRALRNAAGLGNTTGAVPVANGGTGATSAAAARTNIGATSRRNITKSWEPATTDDVSIKVFALSAKTIGAGKTAAWSTNVNRSGYVPIAVEITDRLPAKTSIAQMYIGLPSTGTNDTVYLDITNNGTASVDVSPMVLVRYLKASILNQ